MSVLQTFVNYVEGLDDVHRAELDALMESLMENDGGTPLPDAILAEAEKRHLDPAKSYASETDIDALLVRRLNA